MPTAPPSDPDDGSTKLMPLNRRVIANAHIGSCSDLWTNLAAPVGGVFQDAPLGAALVHILQHCPACHAHTMSIFQGLAGPDVKGWRPHWANEGPYELYRCVNGHDFAVRFDPQPSPAQAPAPGDQTPTCP
jgi:hypothetical protein